MIIESQGDLRCEHRAQIVAAPTTRFTVVHHCRGRWLVGVEDLQRQPRHHRTQHAAHQLACANRGIYIADELTLSFSRRRRCRAVAVDRQIDQYAGLGPVTVFLHQSHFAAQCRQPGIPGAYHRGAAHRIGKHIEPKRAQIAPAGRLKIKYRRVFATFARWPYLVFCEAVGLGAAF